MSKIITFDRLLSSEYLFKDYTLGFSNGYRLSLRYALESGYAYYTKLNLDGPQPFDYLVYAKNDLYLGLEHGAINALGNAKRAVHLILEKLFEVWGLSIAYSRASFPAKLEIMSILGAFPVKLLNVLNQKRNIIEHKYKAIKNNEAIDFIELAEMFLMLAHPYLKHASISAVVGIQDDERCFEWEVDSYNCKIFVYEIANQKYIDTSIGRVYYDISIGDADRQLVRTIDIMKSNQNEWVSYLDLFVYLTREKAHHLPKPDERGEGLYISKVVRRFSR